MRQYWARILSLIVALALVVNGAPAAAELLYLGVVQKQAAMSGSVSDPVGGMTQAGGDCCNDCTPAAAKDMSCFATCVHLPALLALAATPLVLSIPVFEPMPLVMTPGRPIAPDPFPPRPLA